MNTTLAAKILAPESIVNLTKDQLLQAWIEANDKLAAAKQDELKLRLQVMQAFPFDPAIKEGTDSVPLGNGYKLQAAKKQNYSLDKESIEEVLEKIEQMGEAGKFIADRLVKWSPELVVREYRDLNDEYKKVFDKVVTVKDGTPSLKLIEPKGN